MVLVQKGKHSQANIADIKHIFVLNLRDGFENTTMYIPCIHLLRCWLKNSYQEPICIKMGNTTINNHYHMLIINVIKVLGIFYPGQV